MYKQSASKEIIKAQDGVLHVKDTRARKGTYMHGRYCCWNVGLRNKVNPNICKSNWRIRVLKGNVKLLQVCMVRKGVGLQFEPHKHLEVLMCFSYIFKAKNFSKIHDLYSLIVISSHVIIIRTWITC